MHPLPEILLVVLCATLSGMEDFIEVKLWGEQRIDFLRRFLPYERGLPSHDTLNDVMNALDPGLFKACFTAWVAGLRDDDPDIVAIDAKTSRRSHARAKGREPLHLVSAWACRQRLVLGREAVDDKSNEIVTIPLLLERLALTGALVTIDAIGTQIGIAKASARALRAHWGIENRLHWVLDVVFHDDLARLRSRHGPENMAINLLRKPKDHNSFKVRRKLAKLNTDCLDSLLRLKNAST